MNSEPDVAATPDVVELEILPGTTVHSQAPAIPVSQIIKVALESGAHPGEIRRVLQDQRIGWKYSIHGQSEREKSRRRRQFRLCDNGCGRSYVKGSAVETCDDCLRERWSQ